MDVGQATRAHEGGVGAVGSVASPDGEVVVTVAAPASGGDGTVAVRFWRAGSLELLGERSVEGGAAAAVVAVGPAGSGTIAVLAERTFSAFRFPDWSLSALGAPQAYTSVEDGCPDPFGTDGVVALGTNVVVRRNAGLQPNGPAIKLGFAGTCLAPLALRRLVAVGTASGTVNLVSAEGVVVETLDAHEETVANVVASRSGRHLVSVDQWGTAIAWDVSTLRPRWKAQLVPGFSSRTPLAIDDADEVAYLAEGSRLLAVDLASGTVDALVDPLGRDWLDRVVALAWSGDGTLHAGLSGGDLVAVRPGTRPQRDEQRRPVVAPPWSAVPSGPHRSVLASPEVRPTPSSIAASLAGNAAPSVAGAADPDVPAADLEALLAELDELVGLAEVKREVRSLSNFLRTQQLRRARGMAEADVTRHLVFAGNPGTGKTTVARVLGRIYARLGFLTEGHLVECSRAELVAGYVGQTAIKTTEVFERARGGVLFVDEAPSLDRGPDDFGRESVDALVKLMEDHRDDVVVIVAGYPDEMAVFLAANPGLPSRFKRTIAFEDHGLDELVAITDGFARRSGYAFTPEAREAVRSVLAGAERGRTFGNGRHARQLFEDAISAQADRLAELDHVTDDDLAELRPEDVASSAGGPPAAGPRPATGPRPDGYL